MKNEIKAKITSIAFSYTIAYFSVYWIFSDPGSDFSSNPAWLFIFIVLNFLILNKLVPKISPETNEKFKTKFFNILLFVAIIAIIFTFILNIFTIVSVQNMLNSPGFSNDWAQALNFKMQFILFALLIISPILVCSYSVYNVKSFGKNFKSLLGRIAIFYFLLTVVYFIEKIIYIAITIDLF